MWASASIGLLAVLLAALLAWTWSLRVGKVSFVDSLWSLFFVLLACVYAGVTGADNARAWLVLALVAVWAVRLSTYITRRNWGQPEDHPVSHSYHHLASIQAAFDSACTLD